MKRIFALLIAMVLIVMSLSSCSVIAPKNEQCGDTALVGNWITQKEYGTAKVNGEIEESEEEKSDEVVFVFNSNGTGMMYRMPDVVSSDWDYESDEYEYFTWYAEDGIIKLGGEVAFYKISGSKLTLTYRAYYSESGEYTEDDYVCELKKSNKNLSDILSDIYKEKVKEIKG